MRIAFVVHGYPPAQAAGVEFVAMEQAEALRRRGHDVVVFARAYGPASGVSLEGPPGATVWRVAPRPGTITRLEHTWDNDAFDAAFERFLDEERPDLVHAQHLVMLSAGLLGLARRRGLPTVLTLHDPFFLCHRLYLLDENGERCAGPDEGARCERCLAELGGAGVARDRFEFMMRRVDEVDRLLAPSRSLAARYEDAWPFLAGRIEIADPGLARSPERPPGRRYGGGVAGDPLRFVFAGAWLPHKGLDLLVRALAELDPARWSLAVVGEEVIGQEDFVERLRALSAGLPVDWRGRLQPDEMPAAYGQADVLVLPSRCDESYSRVAREARAAGLAVVAPSTGGPAEALVDGRDALLVEPASPGSLTSALRRLLDDPRLVRRLAAAPARWTTADEAAGRLESVYRAALAPAGVAPGDRAPATVRRRRPRVTVAYVTKNGADLIDESLGAVREQEGDFDLVEVLAVDSGSTDGTLETLGRHGVRILRIPPSEFGHGRTRNLAAREARGDVVVLLTQDATPADRSWLEHLLAPLAADPLLAGVWSRHVPRPGCHPMECRRVEEFPLFHGPAVVVSSARGGGPGGEFDCWFSNNSAAIPRAVLSRFPFPEVEFAEDQAWARLVLRAGFRVALVNDSLVRHSHDYSPWVNLQRHFDHARAMREALGRRDDLTIADALGAVLRESRRDLAYWARRQHQARLAVAARWAVPAAAYHLGAFGGRWLGARADVLPRRARRLLSLHDRLRGAGGGEP